MANRRDRLIVGRPELPIAVCSTSLHALASWLRTQRGRAGYSYAQLAQRSPWSEDTLRRAASGKQIPRLTVVCDFADACGSDPREGEQLWQKARYESAKTSADQTELQVTRIDYVQTYTELHAALLDLYRRDGSRPYRELDRRAGGHGQLPHATISRVFNKYYLPRRDFVVTFARTCGAQGSALKSWGLAWDRANIDLLAQEERAKRLRRSSRERTRRLVRSAQYPYVSPASREPERYRIADCAGCYRVIVEPSAALTGQFWCVDCGRDRIPRESWKERRGSPSSHG
ncbi:helix-turn-helix domain-containing protein [Streptomyces microflavus]|uniref:helix-turn-helix domain-containing protein n=1 Tax=Streptomyces microflavus TaxID=1919 RepID=UPI00365E2091